MASHLFWGPPWHATALNGSDKGTLPSGPLRYYLHPLIPLVWCTEAAFAEPLSAIIVVAAAHSCFFSSLRRLFWCHTVIASPAQGIYGTPMAGHACGKFGGVFVWRRRLQRGVKVRAFVWISVKVV